MRDENELPSNWQGVRGGRCYDIIMQISQIMRYACACVRYSPAGGRDHHGVEREVVSM